MQPHDRWREEVFRGPLFAVVEDVLQPELGHALVHVDISRDFSEVLHVPRDSWIFGRGMGSPQNDGSGSLPNDDEVIRHIGPWIRTSAMRIHNLYRA